VRRVFKYTNALVVILGIAFLGLSYRFFSQSLPETAGELEGAVSSAATVTRDEHGIAHIEAARIEDAIYLQGFVHAQDRFWQMEATRRLAAGEMAEIAGPAAVESDLQARQLRLRRLAQAMVETLEPEDHLWLAAYARGVNDWLLSHQDKLPLEVKALNYTPRPWQIADSMLLVLHMYRQLSSSWTVEADQQMILSQAADKEKVRTLFPTRSGAEIQLGSNGWALAGSRTQSGKPILAGDPHLQFSWPSTFHITHLKAEALDVIGASLPGAPAIVIGHNQKVAWTMTTLHYDVQDLYYNETRLIGIERETIRVKGGRNIELNVQVTPNGPVVERGGARYAMKWIAFEGKYPFAFRNLNLAQNWTEFRTALARFPGPCHNFIYADVEGNIGYQAAGKMPLRGNADSSLPMDAQDPKGGWTGFIPFEEMPTAYNPKDGVLISANQNPFPADYKYPVKGIFTPPYRQRQIANLIATKPKWQAAEMAVIQKDVYSAFHHFLAKELAKAGRSRKSSREDFTAAIEVLEGWNGQMEAGLAAPVLVSLAFEELKRAVIRNVTNLPVGFESHFAPSILEDLLSRRPKNWFADYDQVLVQALLDAIEVGVKQQGKNPKFWDYGRFNRLSISNLVLGEAITVGKFIAQPWMPFASAIRTLRLPLVDQFVQAGPVPWSGSTLSVKAAGMRNGPAFRFIADTADWDQSYLTLTLGQSGHTFAKHSKDYWETYLNGGVVRLPYKQIQAESVLRFRPRS
jgi:penicillin amidase